MSKKYVKRVVHCTNGKTYYGDRQLASEYTQEQHESMNKILENMDNLAYFRLKYEDGSEITFNPNNIIAIELRYYQSAT